MDGFNENSNPVYVQEGLRETPREMSVGDWVFTLFIALIPLVNLIMLIVWATSGSYDYKSRKNWAIAQLIWSAISIVICWGFIAIFIGSIAI